MAGSGFLYAQMMDELYRVAKESGVMWITIFDPKTLLGAVLYGLITFLLALLIARAVKLAIHRSLDRRRRPEWTRPASVFWANWPACSFTLGPSRVTRTSF